MSRTMRVLIVEDNPADGEMMLRELRRAGYDPQWTIVDTEADYRAQLESGLDLILADYTMPHFSARQALALLQESGRDLPFIIVSGTIGEDQAVEVMRQGAWDYLLKDRMGRLGPAVALALEKRRLRKENADSEAALRMSEHKYRQLFENLGEAAVLMDLKTRHIVDVNAQAEELFGRLREELLGGDESKLFPPDPTSADGSGKLSRAAALGPGHHWVETEILAAKDRRVPVQISVSTTEVNDRPHVLALMTDITVRKQKEEALRLAKVAAEEANTRANGMLSNMNREIRSPMSGLVGLLDLLMDEIPMKRREMLESGRLTAISLLRMLDESEDLLKNSQSPLRPPTDAVGAGPAEFYD